MRPVVVAGHVCLDLTPALDSPPAVEPGRLIAVGPLALSPGGCVSNTGLGLAALGVPTQLVADAGSDELGRVLIALLDASGAGADTAGIARLEGRVTSYSVVVDFPGRDRTFWHHVGANAAFDGGGVVERLAAATRDGREPILHLGYVTHLPALYAEGGAALIRLVEAARSAGAMVSFDMAEIAPGTEARAVDWEGLLARALPAVDVIKASTDDLAAMMPGRAAGLGSAEWADLLVELGAATALVTAGADGLDLRTGSKERIESAARALRTAGEWSNSWLHLPSLATEVKATTGAGDAAAAGFLAGLAEGAGPTQCALLSAAAAAARISGRPMAQAREMAAGA